MEEYSDLSAAVTLLKSGEGQWLGLPSWNQKQDFLGCNPTTTKFLCYFGHVFKIAYTRFPACQNSTKKSSYLKFLLCLVGNAVTRSCPPKSLAHHRNMEAYQILCWCDQQRSVLWFSALEVKSDL